MPDEALLHPLPSTLTINSSISTIRHVKCREKKKKTLPPSENKWAKRCYNFTAWW